MPELLPWQQPLCAELLRKWQQHSCVLNAMPTGTGKTYLALEAERQRQKPFLVISPKAVVSNWRRLVADFGLSTSCLDIVNTEKLATTRTPWWDGHFWGLSKDMDVVVDEAHKGSCSPKAKTALMMASLRLPGCNILLQTATLADSPLKMRATGYLLGLHQFYRESFYNWCRQHGCHKSPWHSGLEFPKGPSGRKHMGDINDLIKDRMLYFPREKIPGMPMTVIESELYDMEARCREEINTIYAEIEDRLKNNKCPLTEQLHRREVIERTKLPLLLELVPDLIEEGLSVVVFVNFRSVLDTAAEVLRMWSPVCIYGGQSTEERDLAITQFQNNATPLCLAMSQAGGIGISLHDVQQKRPRISLIFPSFNATEMLQCLGRIDRIGGTPTVQRFLLVAGTLEERIHQALQHKIGNIQTLNDGDLSI